MPPSSSAEHFALRGGTGQFGFLPYEQDERMKLFFDMSEVEGGGRDFAGENDRVMRG